MRLEVEENLSKSIAGLAECWDEALDEALYLAAQEVRNEIVLNKLSGNPVHRRSGNLADSVSVNRKGEKEIEVGSFGVEYGKYLERSPRFHKYRWLKPGWYDSKERFVRKFRRTLSKLMFLKGG